MEAPPAAAAAERPLLLPAGGMLAALALALLTAVLCLVYPPFGALAPLVYTGGSAALSLSWRRTAPERVVELALWTWLLAPGVRRVVDMVSGFHPDSLVLVAPLAVSVLCLVPAAVAARRAWPQLPVPPRVRWLAVLLSVLLAYGAGVGVLVGRPVPAVALAFLQAAAPLALGVSALVLLPRARRVVLVDRFAVWGCLLVGGYGVVQFLVAPQWDRQWLRDVADVASSFGYPEPLGIRVFSTVNDPVSLAAFLSLAVLWLALRRRLGVLGWLALAVGLSCLGLTLVRAAWVAVLLGVLLACLRGWVRVERLAVVVVVVIALLPTAGPTLAPVVERVDKSVSSGSQDESFQARIAFQSAQVLPSLTSVSGAGLASTGTAVRRDAAADQRFANSDSGYLEVLRTYGGPLGAVLVISTFSLVLAVQRRTPPEARGAAALLAAVPVTFVFNNALVGVLGVALWCSLMALVDGPQDERRVVDLTALPGA
ncbi:hypothetical protein ACUN7V_07810 [Quadrisphaera oryzae]|uniref:hypothetical protein n=1 Tax=Quadrisphaera TaxID=317661 RepID=UPI001647A236|nr:hypothetical protein [Quadrisphaera sp. RL12-1S]MBC3761710.1 hypothetical protein [Quadrisphaera sp. RL12-1S]